MKVARLYQPFEARNVFGMVSKFDSLVLKELRSGMVGDLTHGRYAGPRVSSYALIVRMDQSDALSRTFLIRSKAQSSSSFFTTSAGAKRIVVS